MADFVMPSLGADMEAGTLVEWLKRPGESVTRGDIIAEVETDKGIIEVETFTSGVIEEILVEPGTLVPVGTVLARIREEGAPAEAVPAESAPPPTPTVTVEPAAETRAASPPAAAPAPRIAISPSARRLAKELGVDPASVQGTGSGGAITREDIERAAASAAAAAPAPAEADDRALRMRQAIAAAMARSKREIPHYYLSTTIDMHPALTWLEQENLNRPLPDRLLYGVLLLKAVALALREFPELNAVWQDEQVIRRDEIHVGAAISLRQGGLVAPAIHNTDQRSLNELMASFRDLVNRARGGRLRSSELSDSTITMTSLGDQGVETVFGIIFPPQVALVGFGKVVERPWIADGQLVPRRVMQATLSADHRASDGHRGALFLGAVDRLLQEPDTL